MTHDKIGLICYIATMFWSLVTTYELIDLVCVSSAGDLPVGHLKPSGTGGGGAAQHLGRSGRGRVGEDVKTEWSLLG